MKYSVPVVGTENIQSVKLIVYDLLGKEIATLVNEQQAAGNYKVEFDASSFPSGVYFYQIKTADPSTSSGQSFVQIRKMMFLK